jgi:hypothetical protein
MALLKSNFRTEFDAQNAGNGVSRLQISKIFQGGMPPDPPDYVVPPQIGIMLQSDF